MPQFIESAELELEGAPKIRAYLFPDGSIRFRLYGAGPVIVSEIHIHGRGQNVVLKVSPREDNEGVVSNEDGSVTWKPGLSE